MCRPRSLLAFGKHAPDSTQPIVFVYGTIEGQAGSFRSDDLGSRWIRIKLHSQRAFGKIVSFSVIP